MHSGRCLMTGEGGSWTISPPVRQPGAAEAAALGGDPRPRRGPRLRALPPGAPRFDLARLRAGRRRRRLDRRLGATWPHRSARACSAHDRPTRPGRRPQRRRPGGDRPRSIFFLDADVVGPSRRAGPGPRPLRGRPRPGRPLRLVRRPARGAGPGQPVPQPAASLRPPAGRLRRRRPAGPHLLDRLRRDPPRRSSSTSAASTPGSTDAPPSRTSSWATGSPAPGTGSPWPATSRRPT